MCVAEKFEMLAFVLNSCFKAIQMFASSSAEHLAWEPSQQELGAWLLWDIYVLLLFLLMELWDCLQSIKSEAIQDWLLKNQDSDRCCRSMALKAV